MQPLVRLFIPLTAIILIPILWYLNGLTFWTAVDIGVALAFGIPMIRGIWFR